MNCSERVQSFWAVSLLSALLEYRERADLSKYFPVVVSRSGSVAT